MEFSECEGLVSRTKIEGAAVSGHLALGGTGHHIDEQHRRSAAGRYTRLKMWAHVRFGSNCSVPTAIRQAFNITVRTGIHGCG